MIASSIKVEVPEIRTVKLELNDFDDLNERTAARKRYLDEWTQFHAAQFDLHMQLTDTISRFPFKVGGDDLDASFNTKFEMSISKK